MIPLDAYTLSLTFMSVAAVALPVSVWWLDRR
jgi:hypothetical protein